VKGEMENNNKTFTIAKEEKLVNKDDKISGPPL
jgi:hypothetical protein